MAGNDTGIYFRGFDDLIPDAWTRTSTLYVNSKAECVFCYGTLAGGENGRNIVNLVGDAPLNGYSSCGHCYHKDCWSEWARKKGLYAQAVGMMKGYCPMCRGGRREFNVCQITIGKIDLEFPYVVRVCDWTPDNVDGTDIVIL
jgi:hypothetical protein